MSEQKSHFPGLSTHNLEGKTFHLPEDFEGELNVVLVAFERWHQDLVDSWVPFLEYLQSQYPQLRFYELPTLSSLYRIVQPAIDGGMAAGIPSKAARERTLTIYTNRDKVTKALALPDRSTIGVFLVDRRGQIFWHYRGAFDDKAGDNLKRMINQLAGK
jgi:hypothetical protein